jgi:hypothetical protein
VRLGFRIAAQRTNTSSSCTAMSARRPRSVRPGFLAAAERTSPSSSCTAMSARSAPSLRCRTASARTTACGSLLAISAYVPWARASSPSLPTARSRTQPDLALLATSAKAAWLASFSNAFEPTCLSASFLAISASSSWSTSLATALRRTPPLSSFRAMPARTAGSVRFGFMAAAWRTRQSWSCLATMARTAGLVRLSTAALRSAQPPHFHSFRSAQRLMRRKDSARLTAVPPMKPPIIRGGLPRNRSSPMSSSVRQPTPADATTART